MTCSCFGQSYTHNVINLGPEYELNGQFKLCFTYDQFGFLWMGSQYGIDRYDGKEVISISGFENLTEDGFITDMWSAPDSILWVFSSKNNNSTHYRKATRVQWIHSITGKTLKESAIFPNGPPFPLKNISSFLIKEDKFFVQVEDGTFYEYKEKFTKIGQLKDRPMILQRWEISPERNIIFVTPNSIFEYNKFGELVREKEFPDLTLYALHQSYDDFFQLRAFHTRQKSSNRRVILNKNWEIVDNLPLDNSRIPFLYKRKDGNYLSITIDGIQIIDKNGQKLADLLPSSGVNEKDFKVEISYQPEKENFTVVQTAKHPSIIYSFQSPFKNHLNEPGNPVSSRGISSTPDGQIFVSSGGSFFEIDSNKEIKAKKFDLNQSKYFGAETVSTYFDSKDSSIWLVSLNFVSQYPLLSKEIKNYIPSEDPPIFSQIIRSKITNEILLASEQGIYTVSSNCNCLKQRLVGNSNHPINLGAINHLEEFENYLLLFSDQTIYKWIPKENSISIFQEFPQSLKNLNVLNYSMSDTINIYIASSGSGVIHWNLSTGKVKTIGKAAGLSSNVAYTVIPDNKGILWIPTTFGLNSYDPKTNEINVYTIEDGLPDNEFNEHSFHKDENGKMYFGGLNGITVFDPNEISLLDLEDPPTFVTEVKIQSVIDSTTRVLDFKEYNQVELSSEEILSVRFSSPNVRNTKATKYQYKFAGKNSQWQDHSGSSLVFSNLKRGEHLLKIRGSGHHKKWSSKEAALKIFVPTPFFQSTLFHILLIVGIIALVLFYFKWRVYNLEKSRQALQREVDKRTISIQKGKELIENQAAELQQLDKLKSQFFTNISHELRTPLTLIHSPLYELKRIDLENPKYQKLIESVDVGSKELKRSIEKILMLSQLNTDTMKVVNSAISFNEIIQQIIVPIQESIEHLERVFHIQYDNNLEDRVLLDVPKLKEIIENLIFNAIKFSKNGSHITLVFGHQGDAFSFRCTDDGIGIPAKDQQKIFEKYFQSTGEKIAAQGGLGLGLPLSRAYAQAMSGQLVLSKSDESGTTFELKIPCELLSGDAAAEVTSLSRITGDLNIPEKKKKKSNGNFSQSNILVVEDNNMMNLMLCNILKVHYHVHSALNGLLALEILKQEKIDLILTDWMMPEMDGPTFIDLIKDEAAFNKIPIIILSARARQSDKMDLFSRGIQDYIIKPFDPEELKVRIQNLLDRSYVRMQEQNSSVSDGVAFDSNSSADQIWIESLSEKTIDCLKQSNFSVVDLASAMNISERQLSRKLKSLLGLTPGNYLKEYRLLKAQHILQEKQYKTVSEVCFAVGFSTPDYFRKLFFERFGKLPSDYLKSSEQLLKK